MIKNIHSFINKHALIPNNATVVLGLSGGPDSVFLLHVLSDMRDKGLIKTLIAAHLDHEWRINSDKDAQFCHEIAKKYNTLLVAKKLSKLSTSFKFNGSKEEWGRNARRFFFQAICKQHDADLVALAHHAQDQQETFFIRLIRGTTLSGLAAMQPRRDNYIRPLLETNKKDIIAFLDTHKISYLTDPSNESDDFLRNRIRNTVLPAIRECDKRFDTKFADALKNIQETNQFLEKEALKHFSVIATNIGEHFSVDIKQFLELPSIIRKRVLLIWLCKEKVKFPVSKGFFKEIIRFLQQPAGGSHEIYKEWQIVKKKGKAFIKSFTS